jgi:hypothetical protein
MNPHPVAIPFDLDSLPDPSLCIDLSAGAERRGIGQRVLAERRLLEDYTVPDPGTGLEVADLLLALVSFQCSARLVKRREIPNPELVRRRDQQLVELEVEALPAVSRSARRRCIYLRVADERHLCS